MSQAFGGWVLDHHALAAWARVEPYAQSLVWSAMEVGMAVAVPVAALPLAYAATRKSEHEVLRALLDLPVTLRDPLTETDAPALGGILAGAADPGALGSDALALACVVHSARRRGWPVLTGSAAALRALDPDLGTDELP
ncbi:MAG: hypothetical protein DLM60_12710 [Pseudonocardiales bacterium]|nr:hypothetical protein [Actinomycetota bacterium]PZS17995.1 MAG: hypothetical protein DLM60_12710 [Pseudonocardiales bacterium]